MGPTRRAGTGRPLLLATLLSATLALCATGQIAANGGAVSARRPLVHPVLAATAVATTGCPPAPGEALFTAPTLRSGAKTVALTFDDGPGASTAQILAVLESFHVPATFFNIGIQNAGWPSVVEDEVAAGFLVGDHTFDHPVLTSLSIPQEASEIQRVIGQEQRLTGVAPCVFRPPYGDYDQTTITLAQRAHLATWLWDVDTEDWKAEGSGSASWLQRIVGLAESEGGALSHPVVLMHNHSAPMPATLQALPVVIRYFESHGYTFVNLLGRPGAPNSCGLFPTSAPSTQLTGGSRLDSGALVLTPNGQFQFLIQRDGNLVLESLAAQVIWQSHTAGYPGAYAVMQRDGNFVLSSSTGKVLWSTTTGGYPGAKLSIQSDGNVMVADGSNVLWCTGSTLSSLSAGHLLEAGWALHAPQWMANLRMQADGNLVLYSISGEVLWKTGTAGHPGSEALMTRGGQLHVVAPSGRLLWTSGEGRGLGAALQLTSEGQLEIVGRTGAILWSAPQLLPH